TWTGEPWTATVRSAVTGRRGSVASGGDEGLREDLHHHPAELRHVRPAPAGDEVAVDDVGRVDDRRPRVLHVAGDRREARGPAALEQPVHRRYLGAVAHEGDRQVAGEEVLGD